jgi:NAD(P)-dependent dehydrogenase (short-subunit alcohol dehydrogenase family)
MNVAVTGGANGIGLAIAQHFAADGNSVAIGDLDGAKAEAAASGLPHDTFGMALDVTDRDAFAAFLDAAEERHGPLDVLVNNAGVDWIGPFDQEPDEVSRREIDINLMGPIVGTRLALQRMLPRGRGHVVNVASGAGRVPLPGSAVYSASKHGIVGLTESLRLEYRNHPGIRFSVVQPAQVETDMLAGQARPRLLQQISPHDVGDAVVKAVHENRFEVWVPANQAVTAKIGLLLPRRAREWLMLRLGLGELAMDTDADARRAYHKRAFEP